MKTKNYFINLLAALLILPALTFTQGVAINTDDSEADPSAMLEIKSNNKGLLIPRMTQSEMNAIANPANGLLVFNTTDSKFYSFIVAINEWKEIAYGGETITPIPQVYNPVTGKTWMDRNLGASQVATSSTDADAFGDLYQWGRLMDSHEDRSSGTTPTLSSTDIPGHGDMIVLNNSPFDWRSPQNGSLWQGVGGTNNPCPAGFRIPTQAEWDEERLSWATNDAAGAFASPLKLTLGGWRHHASGALANVGSGARYWGSTINGIGSDALGFSSGDAFVSSGVHAYGFSVRCIKDEPINQPPNQPTSPSPANETTDHPVGTTLLSWTCSDPENDPLTYDVYFGYSYPLSLVSAGQTATTYDPGVLNIFTYYYWKIVATDNKNNSTEGPEWSFRTFPEPNCDDGYDCTSDYFDYSTGQCMHEPDDFWCDNGLICDGEETCDPYYGCMQGTPPDVDDGIDCTIDFCDDFLGGIIHDPDDSFCGPDEYCDPEFGCMPWFFSCGNEFIDSLNGQAYNTVQIGSQCWMAENLNMGTMINSSTNQVDNGTIEKYCYADNSSNCDTYGGLYKWDEMMEYSITEGTQGICPNGWHVPTDSEYNTLVNFLGGSSVAGGEMKEAGTALWNPPNTRASNSSGFSNLPGSYRDSNGSFPSVGDQSKFWTSSENGDSAFSIGLNNGSTNASFGTNGKDHGFSVRCIKD